MFFIIFLLIAFAVVVIFPIANLSGRESKTTAAFSLIFIGTLLSKLPLNGWYISVMAFFGLIAILVGHIQLAVCLDKRGKIGALLFLVAPLMIIFMMPLIIMNSMINSVPSFLQDSISEVTSNSLQEFYVSIMISDTYAVLNMLFKLMPVVASVLWLYYEPFKRVKPAVIMLLINYCILFIWTGSLFDYIAPSIPAFFSENQIITQIIIALLNIVTYYVFTTQTSTADGTVNRGTRSLLIMALGLVLSLFILLDNDSKFILISLLGIIVLLIGVSGIRAYTSNHRGMGRFTTYSILMIVSLIVHFLPGFIGDTLAVLIQIPAYIVLSTACFRFAGNDLFSKKNGMRTMGTLSLLLIISSIIYLFPMVGESISSLIFCLIAVPIIIVVWRNAIVSQADQLLIIKSTPVTQYKTVTYQVYSEDATRDYRPNQSPTARFCDVCGTKFDERSNFCGNCGSQRVRATQIEETITTPPPIQQIIPTPIKVTPTEVGSKPATENTNPEWYKSPLTYIITGIVTISVVLLVVFLPSGRGVTDEGEFDELMEREYETITSCYKGTIANSNIVMRLDREMNAITGEYYYTNVKKPISLIGSVQDELCEILEYVDGENTGTFKLTLNDDLSLSGLWNNGSKTFKVELKQSDEVYQLDKFSEMSTSDIVAEGKRLRAQKDYANAFDYLSVAANRGDYYAMIKVGAMYEYGQYVEQNYEMAFDWFMKAARHGYAEAEYYVGDMYEYGKGVEKDLTLALEWYSKAAAQGNAGAQKRVDYLQ